MLRRVVVSAGITRPAAFHTTTTAAVATASQISSVSSSSSSSSFTCIPRLIRSQTVSTPVLLANTSLRQSRLYMSEESTATSTSTSTNTPKQHTNHNSAASTDASVATKMNFTPEVLNNRITAMHAAGKHVKVYVDAHLIA